MSWKALWLPVVGSAVACASGPSIPSSGSIALNPGRPECPHYWDFKAKQMALVGPTINVPEFHDCQRFIVYQGTVPEYDSLYAIFAAHGLDSLDTALAHLDTSGTGHIALAAAEVYAEGVYLALGIRTTFSCLYLYRDTVWMAKMVSVGTAEQDCSQPVDPATVNGVPLEVHRDTLTGFADHDFPPVARWDWDPTHQWQIIGLKCGRAWCEVGQPGFLTTPPPDISIEETRKLRRTRMIKGWFDQQFLAENTVSGQVKPSTIWGTIWPDSGLDDYDTINVFKRGLWVHVAQVALEDRSGVPNPPNPYKDRMNLDITGADGPFNTIHLCHGSKSECSPNLAAMCDGDGQWWGRVVDASSDTTKARYMCTVRRPHDALGEHIVGTARWRWLASDETTWKRCDNGCCELH